MDRSDGTATAAEAVPVGAAADLGDAVGRALRAIDTEGRPALIDVSTPRTRQ